MNVKILVLLILASIGMTGIATAAPCNSCFPDTGLRVSEHNVLKLGGISDPYGLETKNIIVVIECPCCLNKDTQTPCEDCEDCSECPDCPQCVTKGSPTCPTCPQDMITTDVDEI